MGAETFGQRVFAMRDELGLSQPALAALFPATTRGERTANWIASIEADKQRIRLDDIPLFAEVLGVTIGWLVAGEFSGDSAFITRLKGLEDRLDERGIKAVLAVAHQQIHDRK